MKVLLFLQKRLASLMLCVVWFGALAASPVLAEHASSVDANSQAGDVLKRWVAEPNDHADALARILAEFPKFLDIPSRDTVFKDAEDRISPLLSKTYANCEGQSVEFGIEKNAIGTYQFKMITARASGAESQSTEITTHPFRPLWSSDDFIVSELPPTERDKKFSEKSGTRSFHIAHLHKEDGRQQIEIFPVILVNGQIQVSAPEKFEESPVLACRKDWKKSEVVLPPAGGSASLSLSAMSLLIPKNEDEKKAIKQVGDYLHDQLTPLSGALLDYEQLAIAKQRVKKAKEVWEKSGIKGKLDALLQKRGMLSLQAHAIGSELDGGNLFTIHPGEKVPREPLVPKLAQLKADLEVARAKEQVETQKIRQAEEAVRLFTTKALSPIGQGEPGILGWSAHANYNRSDLNADYWDAEYVRDIKKATYTSYAGFGSPTINVADKDAARDRLLERVIEHAKFLDSKVLPYAANQAAASRRSIADKIKEVEGNIDALRKKRSEFEAAFRSTEEEFEQLVAMDSDFDKKSKMAEMVEKTILARSQSDEFKKISLRDGESIHVLSALAPDTEQAASQWLSWPSKIFGLKKPKLFQLSEVDPSTHELKRKGILAIGHEGITSGDILFIGQNEGTWVDAQRTKLYLQTKSGLDPNPINARELINNTTHSNAILRSEIKENVPASEVIDLENAKKFFAQHGLDSSGVTPNIVYMPGMAQQLKSGTIAGVLAQKAALAAFAPKLPEPLASRVLEDNLGKDWLLSLYPSRILKTEGRDAVIHEWTHLLDLKKWHVTPNRGEERPDQPRLAEEFERVFPHILELERKGERYQQKFREFIEELPADEARLATVSTEAAEELNRKAFEEDLFGPDARGLKQSLKEKYAYLRSPTEQIAFAVEVAYLRDVEKASFDDVLKHLQRLSGRHPSSTMTEFERSLFKRWYENSDLKGQIEDARSQATSLFR